MIPGEYKKEFLFLIVAVIFIFVFLASDFLRKQWMPVASQPTISVPTTPKYISPSDAKQPLGLITVKIEKHIGNVTGTVEYLPTQSTADTVVFLVSLNTHSVDLDGFDFTRDIRLITDGQTMKPLSANPSGDNHHRKADVTFPRPTVPFTIVLFNIDGNKRSEFVFDK